MTGDIAGCFPEGVVNPSPPPSSSLLGDGVLVCPLPQVFVADLLWPSDVEDVGKAAVNEGLQLIVKSTYCCHFIIFNIISHRYLAEQIKKREGFELLIEVSDPHAYFISYFFIQSISLLRK